MPGKGRNGVGPTGPRDRELWRRGRDIEALPDEAERFLDLAAFADGRLDDDDTARIAALIALDSAAAGDVAAARAVVETAALPADERIVARAAALIGASGPGAAVIAFPPPHPAAPRPWFSAARWSGLAAAIVLASWLGFNLGSGFYDFGATARSADEVSASELFDPAPLLLRDFTESPRI